MCGIVGLYRLDGEPAGLEAVVRAREKLAHRGPDDAGEWAAGPVAFGFRRLSILDLEGGHQPMHSADGRLSVVFNGEIYNHPRLKAELEAQGVRYRTRSDTETILHLYEREGPEAFSKLEGMFALALWDERAQELFLARDGLGVKPLYYFLDGKTLAFASELKALSGWSGRRLDPAAVMDYLRFGFVHAPKTVVQNVLKLPPGHWLRAKGRELRCEMFWKVPKTPSRHRFEPRDLPQLESLLEEAVKGQLLSDVPVGAFLSGGVDSSLVAALMAKIQGRVRTFSIGFSGAKAGLDESAHARAVARHIGAEHHELILKADVLSDIGPLAECLDEPLADSAILPTYLLARFARQSVKVVLTGEGADELFGGYHRYKAAYLSQFLSRGGVLSLAASLVRGVSRDPLYKSLPVKDLQGWAEASAHCTAAQAGAVLEPDFCRAALAEPFEWLEEPRSPYSFDQALALDLKTVLCDCLLMKVDKATMRASLEARVPYLDRRLVEFAARLSPEAKLKRFKGKYILRRLAEKYLPRSIAFRRKHGFLVPWEEWVRSPQNGVLDALLAERAFAEEGVFETGRLRRMLGELRAGSREADPGLLFRVAVFGLWFDSLSAELRR